MEFVQDPKELQNMSPLEQAGAMEEWFRQNYENPAERTPFESREGGYIWIWGGPYDALEELGDKFGEFVSDEVIQELAEELDGECPEWGPAPKPSDYDDYIVDDISKITEAYANFSLAISVIEQLLKTIVAPEVECQFYRLLYSNVITSLETYLSDSFISRVMTEKSFFKKLVQTNQHFKNQKVTLAEVPQAAEDLESTVKTYLLEVVWHNLKRVSSMYESTFGLEFPDELGDIYRAILIRHDIVHRNGKDKDGKANSISQDDIVGLIGNVKEVLLELDTKLQEIDFPDLEF